LILANLNRKRNGICLTPDSTYTFTIKTYMKKLKLSLAALIFACSMFAISPVKAVDPGEPCGGIDPDSGSCGGSGSSDSGAPGLPINNAVWLLVAAGVVIGTKVAFAKGKAVTKVK